MQEITFRNDFNPGHLNESHCCQCCQVFTLVHCFTKSINKTIKSYQGAHYESTYNVNYKGEVGTQYLGFRKKNSFYCPVSDKGSEN